MALAFYRIVESPVGRLRLTVKDDALTALDWTDDPADDENGDEDGGDEDGLLATAAGQLAAYFAGRLQRFDLPLTPVGTDFRQRVWAAMRDIPYGETLRYGEVARLLGSGPRAVGGACGANPIPIIIPCHRILAGQGMGGYSGRGGLETKTFLLRHEARWKN